MQIVNDLKQDKENIQSLSTITLKSRISGHALVYRDKLKFEKPSLLILTHFGFEMGPEFSSDIAGDGPRRPKVSEDEFDPELERIQKRKATKKGNNRKRKRSKAERKADNLKQHPKRSKAERKADNLKQNPKRSKADRKKKGS